MELPGKQQRRVLWAERRVATPQWSLHAGIGQSREEATNCINLGRLLGLMERAGALPPGFRLGAQAYSQPVEQLRERMVAAPATNAQVYTFKTVPKGWSWGLPAQKRWEQGSISQI